MLRNDLIRLHHILDAAREAVSLAQGRSRKDLDIERTLNLALVRLLEIIGEAARGVSADMREAHSEISWKKMSGMRDRLIHGYFNVNLDIIWQTVTQDLPPIIVQIEKIIRSREKRE